MSEIRRSGRVTTARSHQAARGVRRGRRLGHEGLERRELLATLTGDFNGDGYDDMAVGVPFEDLDGVPDAGVVQVVYGSRNGLSGVDELLSQALLGTDEQPESYDYFGSAVAAGDFNRDGIDDLAVGVSGEDLNGEADAGETVVFYGTRFGFLSPSGDLVQTALILTQDTPGMPDTSEQDDQMGYSLTAGDFNGDGTADLAIGVPQEDVGSIRDAGAVTVVYGQRRVGLTTRGSQFWTQNVRGVRGRSQPLDSFGYSLAAGDFDGDRRDDLAIGVPGEDIGRYRDAGVAQVLYGSRSGIQAGNDDYWSQSNRNIKDRAEAHDWFGNSLAAGDFNGDRIEDLAISAPGEDLRYAYDAGAVHVLNGRRVTGLTTRNDQFFTQGSGRVDDRAESGDQFGNSLVSGDFNGDRIQDLAIGALYEDVGRIRDAGSVNVLYGSRRGLAVYRDDFWTQDSRFVDDSAENDDTFGSFLQSGDFNGDGYADLAIGVVGEDINGVWNAGAVNVLYGSRRTGLTSRNDDFWHQGLTTTEMLEARDGAGVI